MTRIKSNSNYTRDQHNIDNIKIVHNPETVPIPLQVRYDAAAAAAPDTSVVPFHEFLAQNCPSLFGPHARFSPTPYLRSGHLQTMYASIYDGSSTKDDITYER